MALQDEKELLIELYEESLNHLVEDFKRVKHSTTKSLIVEEMERCEKRLEEIKQL